MYAKMPNEGLPNSKVLLQDDSAICILSESFKLLHNFSKNVMSTNMLITFHIFHLKAIHSHTKSYVGVTTCATTHPHGELWVVEGSPYMDPPSPLHYSQLAMWTSCGTNCATSCGTSIILIPWHPDNVLITQWLNSEQQMEDFNFDIYAKVYY